MISQSAVENSRHAAYAFCGNSSVRILEAKAGSCDHHHAKKVEHNYDAFRADLYDYSKHIVISVHLQESASKENHNNINGRETKSYLLHTMIAQVIF